MDMDESDRCLYNKSCGLLRALKRNGERHRYCACHREHQNDAQRRWQRAKGNEHVPRPYTRRSGFHTASVAMPGAPLREHGILDDDAALDGLLTLVVEFELANTTRSDTTPLSTHETIARSLTNPLEYKFSL